ncbi:hypothetical protein [Polaromonas sp. P5_D5]
MISTQFLTNQTDPLVLANYRCVAAPHPGAEAIHRAQPARCPSAAAFAVA